MNPALLAAVAIGGATGSLGRYLLGVWLRTVMPGFPWATLAVNLIGGFAMGVVTGIALLRPAAMPEPLRLGLTTGLLGGFTTFSAFSIETLLLWRDGPALPALANVAGNVGFSLAACALGFWLARSLA